ncbi:MAG TPA: sigma-70 family RNA polymerase sigma factor [Terriglobia bacterium]|nr:sigma-70 family RNA polymerase sigma factor [Terriglobia bacterium]
MESALTTTMEMAASRQRTAGIAVEEFDQIVRSHQRRVFRVLFSLVRDQDAADNLTQDCFLRAYQARATFRGDASVETWLIRIAVNLARDHARNRRLSFWRSIFQRTGNSPDLQAGIEISDPSPSAERALLAREQLANVEIALEKISAQQRIAFSLRFFEEMTLEQVAGAMQLEIGTVKAHLNRAVKAVRNHLGKR